MQNNRDFGRVYEEYFDCLLLHARRKLVGCGEMYHSAEDYVHETFLRLYAEWNDPRVQENMRAWLTRVLDNCILSEWRRQSTRNQRLGKPIAPETADYMAMKTRSVREWDVPYSKLFELHDVLERGLTQEEYQLFSLRYLLERSYAQISRKMGHSIPMVGKKIWKLKKKLRVILKDEM